MASNVHNTSGASKGGKDRKRSMGLTALELKSFFFAGGGGGRSGGGGGAGGGDESSAPLQPQQRRKKKTIADITGASNPSEGRSDAGAGAAETDLNSQTLRRALKYRFSGVSGIPLSYRDTFRLRGLEAGNGKPVAIEKYLMRANDRDGDDDDDEISPRTSLNRQLAAQQTLDPFQIPDSRRPQPQQHRRIRLQQQQQRPAMVKKQMSTISFGNCDAAFDVFADDSDFPDSDVEFEPDVLMTRGSTMKLRKRGSTTRQTSNKQPDILLPTDAVPKHAFLKRNSSVISWKDIAAAAEDGNGGVKLWDSNHRSSLHSLGASRQSSRGTNASGGLLSDDESAAVGDISPRISSAPSKQQLASSSSTSNRLYLNIPSLKELSVQSAPVSAGVSPRLSPIPSEGDSSRSPSPDAVAKKQNRFLKDVEKVFDEAKKGGIPSMRRKLSRSEGILPSEENLAAKSASTTKMRKRASVAVMSRTSSRMTGTPKTTRTGRRSKKSKAKSNESGSSLPTSGRRRKMNVAGAESAGQVGETD